jgi:DNA-binding GntR family transcriptional regulator
MIVHAPLRKAPRPPKRPRKVGRHALRDRLIALITSGKFRPGEKLVQLTLAEKFDVSLSLLREAILDLQAYGLVESDDNRGFFVRRFDTKALLDLIDVREVLEGLAARKACALIQPAEVAELAGLIAEMGAAAVSGQHEHRAELDRRFHDRIAEISGNTSVVAVTRQCSLFSKVVWTEADAAHIRRVHTELLDAIRKNLPEEAERVARAHVRDTRRRVEERAASGGAGIYWLGSEPESGTSA